MYVLCEATLKHDKVNFRRAIGFYENKIREKSPGKKLFAAKIKECNNPALKDSPVRVTFTHLVFPDGHLFRFIQPDF